MREMFSRMVVAALCMAATGAFPGSTMAGVDPAGSPEAVPQRAYYTRFSPLQGVAPLTADQVYASVERELPRRGRVVVQEYLVTLESLCDRLGLDFVLMAAQWDLETGTGSSEWWRERRNPAGIGVTGDPSQDEASQTWPDGEAAAYGHVAHMVAYVWGPDWIEVWPAEWPHPVAADQRFLAPFKAGYRADRLSQLNGTWAIDPDGNYDEKLARRANKMLEAALDSEQVSGLRHMQQTGALKPRFVTPATCPSKSCVPDELIGSGPERRLSLPVRPRNHAGEPTPKLDSTVTRFTSRPGPNQSIGTLYVHSIRRLPLCQQVVTNRRVIHFRGIEKMPRRLSRLEAACPCESLPRTRARPWPTRPHLK